MAGEANRTRVGVHVAPPELLRRSHADPVGRFTYRPRRGRRRRDMMRDASAGVWIRWLTSPVVGAGSARDRERGIADSCTSGCDGGWCECNGCGLPGLDAPPAGLQLTADLLRKYLRPQATSSLGEAMARADSLDQRPATFDAEKALLIAAFKGTGRWRRVRRRSGVPLPAPLGERRHQCSGAPADAPAATASLARK